MNGTAEHMQVRVVLCFYYRYAELSILDGQGS